SAGGNIVVGSLAEANRIPSLTVADMQIGAINTQSTAVNGLGGSVGISAPNNVTIASINTSNTSVGGTFSKGGGIFVSATGLINITGSTNT
ncbi:hypothetical protein ACSTHF_23330, partial [Vibrio parahaemolyticus]